MEKREPFRHRLESFFNKASSVQPELFHAGSPVKSSVHAGLLLPELVGSAMRCIARVRQTREG